MLVAAFIFLAPGADPAVHRKTVEIPGQGNGGCRLRRD